MKKLLLLLCILFSVNTYADQLAYLTRAQAEKTIKFLKDNSVSEAILWCGCCSNERMEKISISNYYSRKVESESTTESYYEVVFVGTLSSGLVHKAPVDLAYVFLRSGMQAKCLGKLLDFECDPCTLPFDWVFGNKSKEKKDKEKDYIDALAIIERNLFLSRNIFS